MAISQLETILSSFFAIKPAAITPVRGGFSTKAAYRVTGTDGMEYFVKVYDKTLPTTRAAVGRIDVYMPALRWLSEEPSLRGRVLTPVRTKNGGYKAETDDEAYVIFHYVNGFMPGINGMTVTQTEELAETLAHLHIAGETYPDTSEGLNEDLSLPFCGELLVFLDRTPLQNGALRGIVSPHAQLLRSAAKEALRLRYTLRRGYTPLVLCHGDAHGNNVLQSDRLVLADWEDLRRAPAEADLFIYDWHPHGDVLLKTYTEKRPGFQLNQNLLHYYVLRRRIEDVWVDIQRLTEEEPAADEKEKLLRYIRLGIENVERVYSRIHTLCLLA